MLDSVEKLKFQANQHLLIIVECGMDCTPPAVLDVRYVAVDGIAEADAAHEISGETTAPPPSTWAAFGQQKRATANRYTASSNHAKNRGLDERPTPLLHTFVTRADQIPEHNPATFFRMRERYPEFGAHRTTRVPLRVTVL